MNKVIRLVQKIFESKGKFGIKYENKSVKQTTNMGTNIHEKPKIEAAIHRAMGFSFSYRAGAIKE